MCNIFVDDIHHNKRYYIVQSTDYRHSMIPYTKNQYSLPNFSHLEVQNNNKSPGEIAKFDRLCSPFPLAICYCFVLLNEKNLEGYIDSLCKGSSINDVRRFLTPPSPPNIRFLLSNVRFFGVISDPPSPFKIGHH